MQVYFKKVAFKYFRRNFWGPNLPIKMCTGRKWNSPNNDTVDAVRSKDSRGLTTGSCVHLPSPLPPMAGSIHDLLTRVITSATENRGDHLKLGQT